MPARHSSIGHQHRLFRGHALRQADDAAGIDEGGGAADIVGVEDPGPAASAALDLRAWWTSRTAILVSTARRGEAP